MKLKTKDLTTDRQWRATTGMAAKQFYKLLEFFKSAYLEVHFKTLADRKVGTSISYCIQDEEELLFFVLFSLKSGLNYDILGIVTGMSASNAQRNQRIGLEVLQKALSNQNCMPTRNFLNVEDFLACFEGEEELIFDATEQRIQRPTDYEKQKDYYSGKKKAHTIKAMAIALKSKVVKYLSHCYPGKTHDFTLLKKEFAPEFNWFDKIHGKVDLGYQGIANQYKFKKLSIPHKKSKNNPLTEEQKIENKKLASERIIVEHCIGGIKRYRCLSDRVRLHDFVFYDVLLGICTGLWNFYLTN